MDEAVREVIPSMTSGSNTKGDFLKGDGKRRFLELSCALFGESGFIRPIAGARAVAVHRR